MANIKTDYEVLMDKYLLYTELEKGIESLERGEKFQKKRYMLNWIKYKN